jgi:ankyrin repeat protein
MIDTVSRAFAAALALSVVLLAGHAAAADLRLAQAAERQDWATVQTLLKSKDKADVNTPQGDGATALHWAAHWNNVSVVELLLRAGARPDVANNLGVTPLWLACENGSAPVVQRLLKAGARANANTAANGETALMTAARAGNVDIVTMLLEGGAEPNARLTTSAQTALMWAVSESHLDIVRLLIARGADVHARSKNGFTPMLFAAQQGNVEIARALIAAGVGVNAEGDGEAPLAIAIDSFRVPFALFLLEQGASPNIWTRRGETALHAALSVGGRRIGFDPDAVLREPANKGKLIAALLARGADPNVRAKRVPLRSNAGAGSSDAAKEADNFGVTRTRRGATPFWVAAENADVASMRLLVEAGANPNVAADDGTTALMAAAGLGHAGDRYERFWSPARAAEAVAFLVEHGADVNATNEAGFTALHGTAFVGADAAIEYLVKHGANINAQDFMKRTPYRIAQGHKGGGMSFVSRPATADVFARLGANTSLGPHFNDTERELAQQR